MKDTLIALQGESLYDLCIRAYGDMRGLPYLLIDNPDLKEDVIITPLSSVTLPDWQIGDSDINQIYSIKNLGIHTITVNISIIGDSGFTLSASSIEVEYGATETITVTYSGALPYGFKNAAIVFAIDGQEDEIRHINTSVVDLYVGDFVLKTISDIDTTYTVIYTGTGTPIWTDGTQTLYGASVEFNFVDDSVHTVSCTVEQIEFLNIDSLIYDDTIYDLKVNKVTTERSSLELSNPTMRRLTFAKGDDIETIISELGVEVIEELDFSATTLVDVDINLYRAFALYKFVQPSTVWSCVSFKISDSLIYDTLDLSKLTIKGSLSLVDNAFISGIDWNLSADWSLCTSLVIDNLLILKRVNFFGMVGLLSLPGSSIRINNIGSSQADMDYMLTMLASIILNVTTGRNITIKGGAPPSFAGMVAVSTLESLEINVDL